MSPFPLYFPRYLHVWLEFKLCYFHLDNRHDFHILCGLVLRGLDTQHHTRAANQNTSACVQSDRQRRRVQLDQHIDADVVKQSATATGARDHHKQRQLHAH